MEGMDVPRKRERAENVLCGNNSRKTERERRSCRVPAGAPGLLTRRRARNKTSVGGKEIVTGKLFTASQIDIAVSESRIRDENVCDATHTHTVKRGSCLFFIYIYVYCICIG